MFTHLVNSITGNKLFAVENGIVVKGDTNFPQQYIGISYGALKQIVRHYSCGNVFNIETLIQRRHRYSTMGYRSGVKRK